MGGMYIYLEEIYSTIFHQKLLCPIGVLILRLAFTFFLFRIVQITTCVMQVLLRVTSAEMLFKKNLLLGYPL